MCSVICFVSGVNWVLFLVWILSLSFLCGFSEGKKIHSKQQQENLLLTSTYVTGEVTLPRGWGFVLFAVLRSCPGSAPWWWCASRSCLHVEGSQTTSPSFWWGELPAGGTSLHPSAACTIPAAAFTQQGTASVGSEKWAVLGPWEGLSCCSPGCVHCHWGCCALLQGARIVAYVGCVHCCWCRCMHCCWGCSTVPAWTCVYRAYRGDASPHFIWGEGWNQCRALQSTPPCRLAWSRVASAFFSSD